MLTRRSLGFSSAFCLAVGIAQAVPPKPKIESVSLARRFPAQQADITRAFKPGDRTLHAIARLSGASSGDKVKAVWIIVDAGGVRNYRFAEKTLGTSRMDTLHFATSVKHDWPRGKYRLDLFWNGTRARQEYFEVK